MRWAKDRMPFNFGDLVRDILGSKKATYVFAAN
jgi:hypothetical protein